MLQIEKIRIDQLEEFINSKRYKEMPIVPISVLRARSYINNPRAEKRDIVLYMLFSQEHMVAYRTVLPDDLIENGNEIHFAWLSGTYVLTEFRRKGFSKLLLNEVENDWGNRTILANFAPEAGKLILNEGTYQAVLGDGGHRYYLNLPMETILGSLPVSLKKIQPLFKSLLWVINYILRVRFVFVKKSFAAELKITNKYTESFGDFLIKRHVGVTNRQNNEFKWITEFPWVSADAKYKEEASKYNFSSYSQSFKNEYLSIEKNGEVVALCWLVFHKNRVTVSYCYSVDTIHNKALSKAICQRAINEDVDFITVYHSELNSEMLKVKKRFLVKKQISKDYLAHKKLLGELNNAEELQFEAGDGDMVFTA